MHNALRPCHITVTLHDVRLHLQGHFKKNTTNSRYKGPPLFIQHTSHQQHWLLVLQLDRFHIKMYKKKSTQLIPSSTQVLGFSSTAIHYFYFTII